MHTIPCDADLPGNEAGRFLVEVDQVRLGYTHGRFEVDVVVNELLPLEPDGKRADDKPVGLERLGLAELAAFRPTSGSNYRDRSVRMPTSQERPLLAVGWDDCCVRDDEYSHGQSVQLPAVRPTVSEVVHQCPSPRH